MLSFLALLWDTVKGKSVLFFLKGSVDIILLTRYVYVLFNMSWTDFSGQRGTFDENHPEWNKWVQLIGLDSSGDSYVSNKRIWYMWSLHNLIIILLIIKNLLRNAKRVYIDIPKAAQYHHDKKSCDIVKSEE
jgi:hypothetical protein